MAHNKTLSVKPLIWKAKFKSEKNKKAIDVAIKITLEELKKKKKTEYLAWHYSFYITYFLAAF